MHEEGAPTGYVCIVFFSSDLSRDREGNVNVHVSWRKCYGDRGWNELAQLLSNNGL